MMKRFILTIAILFIGSPVMAKTYEGKIILKPPAVARSITVQAEANSPSEAMKIIEAQYSGKIKQWTKRPSPKR